MAEDAVPFERFELEPVPCQHPADPGRVRGRTLLMGGQVHQLCEECFAARQAEWRRVADQQLAEFQALRAEYGTQ